MPRPKPTNPKERFEVQIRPDLAAKLKLHLFSELEGRVPYGAVSSLFEQLLADYLGETGEMYLAPFFPQFEPRARVRGNRHTIEALRELLEAMQRSGQ